MSSDLPDHAIHLQGVSKHYLIYKRPEDRLKQMIMPKLRRMTGMKPRKYFTDFAAVHDVDFTVERGETVGIIGRNGSGKSTLLQMICGILQPSSGSVEVNGRIAALLELGAGFNADFTGRENVFLNAAILGLTREETEARFDSIARFADIGIFIDQPVKTYSSGMYVRLAFAVAINVDPDILVVDEALSVGDEAFQRKCFARIEQIRESGATILFVSHSAQTIVQLCDRAILMDGGEKLMDGVPKTVVSQYQRLIYTSPDKFVAFRESLKSTGNCSEELDQEPESNEPEEPEPSSSDAFLPELKATSPNIYPEDGARISNLRIVNSASESVNVLTHGEKYEYKYDVEYFRDFENCGFGMAITSITGLHLYGTGSHEVGAGISVKKGDRYTVSFPFVNLLGPGTYFTNAGAGALMDNGIQFAHRITEGFMFRVGTDSWNPRCSSVINIESDSPRFEQIRSDHPEGCL